MPLTRLSFLIYSAGSAERVVAHAAWRRSRGRGPAMSYAWKRNPTEALRMACLNISNPCALKKFGPFIESLGIQPKLFEPSIYGSNREFFDQFPFEVSSSAA